MQSNPQVTMQSSPIGEDLLPAHSPDTSFEHGVLEKENPVDNSHPFSPNPHPENTFGLAAPIQDSNKDSGDRGFAPSSPGTVTVTGALVYWDDYEGVYHDCRYAYCELWDDDADGYDDRLDTSTTDASGWFSFDPVNNYDEEGEGQDIYVLVYTDSKTPPLICKVSDGSNTYVCRTPTIPNVSDGKLNCGTYEAPPGHWGAWNIFDQIIKGYQWVDAKPYTDGPPKATVIWFIGNPEGSYFDRVTHEIYILGKASDPDEFDDGIMLHEYGHFLAHVTWTTKQYVFDNSPGGYHMWNCCYSPELAWSEGWATYFSCAVREIPWMHDVFTGTYGKETWVDFNVETGVATWESGSTQDGNDNGDSCEASCGGVLWDISDSANDDQDGDGIGDALSLTQQMVWYVVRVWSTGGHGVYTIDEFLSAWLTYYHRYEQQVRAIYYEHGINREDSVLPLNPNAYSSSHTVNVWSNNHTITVSWSGADDGLSGVYGYSYVWDKNPSTVPGTTSTTRTTTASTFLADGGNWYFHVRVRDNAGNWASGAYHIGPFKIDGTAPSNPTSYSPIPANAIYWTNDSTITVTWYFASDSLSGVFGYSFVWDTSPSTIPDTVVDTLGTSNTSSVLADGSWYLHVRVRDNAGDWASEALHCGPLRIDTVLPTNPDSSTSSPDVDVWSTDNTIEVSWSGAADEASGISGYSYVWDHSPSSSPDTTVDTMGTSIVSSKLADGSDWYFHVRVRDKAGNWAEDAYHVGPFKIDTGAPANPDSASSSPGVNVWSADNTIEISWSGASDDLSDISGYSFVWDNSPSTLPDETVDTTSTNTTSSALADGISWYFHIITMDSAGNWNNKTFHVGPFKIDTVTPKIDSTNPEDGASDVSIGTTILIEFSESMNTTVTQQSTTISPAVEIKSFTWSNENKTLTIVMNETLQYGTEYTVSISNARDVAGNEMTSYSWKFNTVTRPIGLSTATLTLLSAAAVAVILLAALAIRRIKHSSRGTRRRSSRRTRRS